MTIFHYKPDDIITYVGFFATIFAIPLAIWLSLTRKKKVRFRICDLDVNQEILARYGINDDSETEIYKEFFLVFWNHGSVELNSKDFRIPITIISKNYLKYNNIFPAYKYSKFSNVGLKLKISGGQIYCYVNHINPREWFEVRFVARDVREIFVNADLYGAWPSIRPYRFISRDAGCSFFGVAIVFYFSAILKYFPSYLQDIWVLAAPLFIFVVMLLLWIYEINHVPVAVRNRLDLLLSPPRMHPRAYRDLSEWQGAVRAWRRKL